MPQTLSEKMMAMPKDGDDSFEEERQDYFDKIDNASEFEGRVSKSRSTPPWDSGRHPAAMPGRRRLRSRERQELRAHFFWPTVFIVGLLLLIGLYAVIGTLAEGR